MLMISCNLSTLLGPRGNNQTCVCLRARVWGVESRAGAGKFSKVELGNRCEWGERGPSRGGWRLLCVSAWARINVRAHAVQLCMQDRAGKGQDMSAHWVSGSFTRCDHFTLPPEALFPPKAFSCSWLSTCSGATGSGRLELFQPTTRPKTTVGRKKRGREEERGEGGSRRNFFCSFPPFLPPSPPPVAPGEHGPGAQESCTAAGKSR